MHFCDFTPESRLTYWHPHVSGGVTVSASRTIRIRGRARSGSLQPGERSRSSSSRRISCRADACRRRARPTRSRSSAGYRPRPSASSPQTIRCISRTCRIPCGSPGRADDPVRRHQPLDVRVDTISYDGETFSVGQRAGEKNILLVRPDYLTRTQILQVERNLVVMLRILGVHQLADVPIQIHLGRRLLPRRDDF